MLVFLFLKMLKLEFNLQQIFKYKFNFNKIERKEITKKNIGNLQKNMEKTPRKY